MVYSSRWILVLDELPAPKIFSGFSYNSDFDPPLWKFQKKHPFCLVGAFAVEKVFCKQIHSAPGF